MAKAFVDRIEGDVAVLLVDGRETRKPLKALPEGVQEGCWLTDDLKRIDTSAGESAAADIAAQRSRLVDDDGGDFSL